jgi:hypothetical protein
VSVATNDCLKDFLDPIPPLVENRGPREEWDSCFGVSTLQEQERIKLDDDHRSPVLAEPAAPPDHHLANLIEIFIPSLVPP